MTMSPALLALMQKVREREQKQSHPEPELNPMVIPTENKTDVTDEYKFTNQYGNTITYNAEQSEFIHLAEKGESCILIGAAGTGKTTCQKGAVSALLQVGNIPIISDTDSHKYLREGAPGIILTSFTRRAVRNLKRAMSEDLKSNCITLHKLLEYQPVQYEIYDAEQDKYRMTMRFEPTRNSIRPLPTSIRTIVFDESSMISTELFQQLLNALHHPVQFIFVGDIQQLPPVFGAAILGYKLLELPVVELTQVYRQALESPIIKLATDIRNGIHIPTFKENIRVETSEGKLTLHPWKKKLHPEIALLTVAKFFTAALDAGEYDPLEDQILIPFNKSLGTIELNKHIAQHLARKQNRLVWEVIAGYNKHYFSVGDLVLFDKEDAEIISIRRNATYIGKPAQKESLTLDYWGFDSDTSKTSDSDFDLESVDAILAAVAASTDTDKEDKVNRSSHLITVRMIDSDEEVTLESAAEINALIHSYALTVHKSQGSEWERVFVVFHQSHNTMIQRELLYTAITRAKKELYVICEPDTFERGVISQKIKGTTLAEKAEYFKGRKEREGA